MFGLVFDESVVGVFAVDVQIHCLLTGREKQVFLSSPGN